MRMLHASDLVTVVLCSGLPLLAQTDNKVSFKNDVAPLLSQKCLQCHGQVASMGSLDLRTRSGPLS